MWLICTDSKAIITQAIFPTPPPPTPHLLFSFFISHSLALRLTPVSVDADILWAFHNPFDVSPSVVMSLFKGFSVVGSALAGFFLEHTMPRSAPVAWDVFGGQQAALAPILAAGIGTGLHGGESCGPESHAPPLVPNWSDKDVTCLLSLCFCSDSANKESLHSPFLAV